MGSTKAGEESASQLHFSDNIFQGGFAFGFVTNTDEHCNELLSVCLLALVSC